MLIIRRAGREDEKAFVRIYKAAYVGLEEYAYRKRKDIRWYFRWLLRRDPEGFFVAEDSAQKGSPIGFIGCDANWISPFEGKPVDEIHELIVHPNWMGKGVGKRLLLKGLEYGKSRGEEIAELWVGYTNFKAKMFYFKMGFEERERIGRWVRMIKNL